MKITLYYAKEKYNGYYRALAKKDDGSNVWVSDFYVFHDPLTQEDLEDWKDEFLEYAVDDPRRLLNTLPDELEDDDEHIMEFEELHEFAAYDANKIVYLHNNRLYI